MAMALFSCRAPTNLTPRPSSVTAKTAVSSLMSPNTTRTPRAWMSSARAWNTGTIRLSCIAVRPLTTFHELSVRQEDSLDLVRLRCPRQGERQQQPRLLRREVVADQHAGIAQALTAKRATAPGARALKSYDPLGDGRFHRVQIGRRDHAGREPRNDQAPRARRDERAHRGAVAPRVRVRDVDSRQRVEMARVE